MLLFYIIITLYTIAIVKQFLYIWIRKKVIFNTAIIVTIAAFIFHTIFLISISIKTGHGPYTSPSEYTSFFSWTIVMIYFLVEMKYKIKDMGVFLIPIVLLLFLYSLYIPEHPSVVGKEEIKFWLTIHRTLSFIGYSTFTLTFVVAFMYMIQENQLKSKQLGIFYNKLPSLEVLDKANDKTIAVGFPLFTIGFISGALIAHINKGSYLSWDIKKTLPLLVTWAIYALLFLGRINLGWRGRRAAILAILGFITTILTFIIHIY